MGVARILQPYDILGPDKDLNPCKWCKTFCEHRDDYILICIDSHNGGFTLDVEKLEQRLQVMPEMVQEKVLATIARQP